MSGVSDKVQIGNSADFLEGVAVDTAAGTGLFREGVVVSDPELEGARQRVTDAEPAADDFGAVVRVAGSHAIIGANEFSTGNSTATPLAANGVFTGEWEDVSRYISINVLINCDRIAALNGLRMDFSIDGVTLDINRPVDITTGGDFITFPCEAKFFRLVVTNGNQAQSVLRVQTHYSAMPRSLKGVPMIDNITDASTATLTRTVIEGKTTAGGGGYVPVKVNPSGTLAVGNTSVGPTGSPVPLEATYVAVNDGAGTLVPLVQPTTPADTQPVSATALPLPTGAATAAKQLPDNHNVTVSNLPVSPSAGGNSSVNASTSQVTLLAPNPSRKGATIYNDSALNDLRISLGPTASSVSFTVVIASDGYYEVPFGYTGIITGIFATNNGAARITELT